MFQSLPGFRDYYPQECFTRNYLFTQWEETMRRFCFQEVYAPVLEPLELFTVKSGEEIVKQLFHFEDQGGRKVALRPEMTPSLARLVAERANTLRKPIKWFSIGEFFRYERPQKGRLRSFYQLNVDILGEPGVGADAEVMASLVATLEGLGLTQEDFVLRLSDRNLWMFYLKAYGLDDNRVEQLLSLVDKLDNDFSESSFEKVKAILGEYTEIFWEELQRLVTIHSIDELEDFFKTTKAPHAKGEIDERLEQWRSLIERLHAFGVKECLKIDFSIVRGLAYYTGFVFEVFERSGKSRALAGGGRYDHLVKKLGGPEVSAVGYAMGDVTMLDLLTEKNLIPEVLPTAECFMVIEGAAEAQSEALRLATELRGQGMSVEYALKEASFSKQFKTVSQLNPKRVLIFSSEDLSAGNVKVLDPKNKKETVVPVSDLSAIIAAIE